MIIINLILEIVQKLLVKFILNVKNVIVNGMLKEKK